MSGLQHQGKCDIMENRDVSSGFALGERFIAVVK